MSDSDFVRKYRLRYLVETYFPDLEIADLHRRVSGEQPQGASEDGLPRGVAKIPEHLMVPRGEGWYVGARAFRAYFEDGLQKPAPPVKCVRAVCAALAREFAHTQGDNRDLKAISDGLFRYVEFGERGPFAILEGGTFPADELSFEHLVPLSSRPLREGPFAKLAQLAPNQPAREFLRGGRPVDWTVLRHVAIQRPPEDELLSALKSARLVLVTGAAGDGKTTLLKRAAMRLREAGWRVLFCSYASPGPFPRLPRFANRDLNTCILVDDADQSTSFPHLEEDIRTTPDIRVVLCARDYKWKYRRRQLSRISQVSVPRLTESEIRQLAAVIEEHDAMDSRASLGEIIDRITRSVNSDSPHLLAGMLSATRGKLFQEIIDDMVNDFKEARDDWALRLVACCSYLSEESYGRLRRVPHRLLTTVARARYLRDHARRPPDEYVSRKLEQFETEIIRIGVDRFGQSEYDLRHPDIVRRVLWEFYRFPDVASFGGNDMSSEDDPAVTGAGAEPNSSPETQDTEEIKPPGGDADAEVDAYVEALVDLDVDAEVERDVDSGDDELSRLSAFARISLLVERGVIHRRVEMPARPDAFVSDFVDVSKWEFADIHDRFLQTGRWSRPRTFNTVLYFLKGRFSLLPWPMVREVADEIGGLLGNYEHERRFKAELLRAWGEAEADPAMWRDTLDETGLSLSDRKISEALTIYPEGAADTWIAWLNSAKHHDKSAEETDDRCKPDEKYKLIPYSSRWLCRSAWESGIRDTRLRNKWFSLEVSAGNTGATDRHAAEFTARWIVRQEWAEDDLKNSEFANFLQEWLALERNGNVGEFVDPVEYTARWVCRQVWDKGVRYPSYLQSWIELEAELQCLGEPEGKSPYTSRWILQQLWNEDFQGPWFLPWWFRFERKQTNLGSPSDPEPYTARWICRQNWVTVKENLEWLIEYLEIEETDNIGSLPVTSEFGARWIYRETWRRSSSHQRLLFRWFALEKTQGNVGSEDQEFTASWIEHQIARVFPPRWDEKLGRPLNEEEIRDIRIYLNAGGTLPMPIKLPGSVAPQLIIAAARSARREILEEAVASGLPPDFNKMRELRDQKIKELRDQALSETTRLRFSHGRSRTITVETDQEGAPGSIGTLTTEEHAERVRILQEARRADEKARRRAMNRSVVLLVARGPIPGSSGESSDGEDNPESSETAETAPIAARRRRRSRNSPRSVESEQEI